MNHIRNYFQTHRRYLFLAAVVVCALVFMAPMRSQLYAQFLLNPRAPQEVLVFSFTHSPSSSLKMDRVTCIERRHLVFLKVHKAGSSTVANIIMRFGVARNLTFALPKKGVIITLWQNQNLNVGKLNEGKVYDILCNHAVYSRERMDAIVAPDSVYISVVREPLAHLQSTLYYFFHKVVPGENKLHRYLRNPAVVGNRRLLNNSMSYELGLSPENFYNKKAILRYLKELDKELAIIMVTERMDESFLLFKRYMCWGLQDILYLSRNVNSQKPAVNISSDDMIILKDMEFADTILYKYSVDRLNFQISKEECFYEELDQFTSMLKRVQEFCTSSNRTENNVLTFPKSRWNIAFEYNSSQCKVMEFNGFQIIQYVKQHQRRAN